MVQDTQAVKLLFRRGRFGGTPQVVPFSSLNFPLSGASLLLIFQEEQT